MRWLCKILASPKSMFKSPRTMGSLKCSRASSRSGWCSNAKGGRYYPMSGFRVIPLNISQLTTFGLC